MLPIDGQPIQVYLVTKITAILGREGRLFLCLSMLKAYRISDTEAGSGQGQDCDQPFYRQHITRPPFLGFPFGFLCNRRVTVPPQRANRLPYMVAPKYIIANFHDQNKCLFLEKLDKCCEQFFVVSDRMNNKNRVGVVCPPLSHHRTCRSAYGGSA